MKTITPNLFNELRRVTGSIAMGWKITRRHDSEVFGFTSYDQEFTYEGITYTPTNAFSGTAAVARSTLSVDNMSAIVLYSSVFTERDLKGGRWDGATCEVFWICPQHPEWGILPLRGGTLGEFRLNQAAFEVDLRSILQRLQQPKGFLYTLDCNNRLGDFRCKTRMTATIWQPNTKYYCAMQGEGAVGDIVRPAVDNGLWYAAYAGAATEDSNWGYDTQLAGTGGYIRGGLDAFGTQQPGSFDPGAIQHIENIITNQIGFSGATEPDFDNSGIGVSTMDNQIEWKAIYPRTFTGTVTDNMSGDRTAFKSDNLTVAADHFFQYGEFRWLTGLNSYVRTEVMDHRNSDGTCYLMDVMSELIQVGDTFEIKQGCSKQRSLCKASPFGPPYGFDNLHNMYAFPDMPTEDRAKQTAVVPNTGGLLGRGMMGPGGGA